ncbi:protein translation factor SUI1 homolog 2-like [Lycium barbarum]|uniref:protein translation factor SUI1 homolog 2-like n=1 Tax=Lycium barbarum TaxID=112863 RepID=UPI00293F0F06|nr:protein translation factor SUI1 homolog 2-like [Lycium barbarum]
MASFSRASWWLHSQKASGLATPINNEEFQEEDICGCNNNNIVNEKNQLRSKFIISLSLSGLFTSCFLLIRRSLVVIDDGDPFAEAKGPGSPGPKASGSTGLEFPTTFDPFAEAKEVGAPGAKEYVRIRIQQRNNRKSVTTIQGLKKEFSYEKILKVLKKEFCCNGNVVQDKELGKVIQLQGDQRKNVTQFLLNADIVKKEQIKIHGF